MALEALFDSRKGATTKYEFALKFRIRTIREAADLFACAI